MLESEREEAERKRVEAEGIRDAQKIIGAGLTPIVLQYQTIQAMRYLAASPNAKVVMTDGRMPFLLNPSEPMTPTITPVSAPGTLRPEAPRPRP